VVVAEIVIVPPAPPRSPLPPSAWIAVVVELAMVIVPPEPPVPPTFGEPFELVVPTTVAFCNVKLNPGAPELVVEPVILPVTVKFAPFKMTPLEDTR